MPETLDILGTKYYNSQIPDDLLITSFNGEKLFKAAAESLSRVKELALIEGFTFRISDGYRAGGKKGDGLRHLKGQVEFTQWAAWELYNRKKSGKIVDPQTGKIYDIGPPRWNQAANPEGGFTSKHGFGLSVDIYGSDPKSKITVATWIKQNPTKKGVKENFINYSGVRNDTSEAQDAFQEWFAENGSIFGWEWTGKGFSEIEPWHFDYNPDKDPVVSRKIDIVKAPVQRNQITEVQQSSYFDFGSSTKLIKNTYDKFK